MQQIANTSAADNEPVCKRQRKVMQQIAIHYTVIPITYAADSGRFANDRRSSCKDNEVL